MILGLPRWLSGKESACNAGNARDAGSIPGSGRSPGGVNGILQYSCLENPMDRGAWQATVHRAAKSWTHMHSVQFSSVQSLSRVWLFATPWTAAHRPPCPSPTPGVYPNSCPLSQWCHPTISSSVVPFSSCPQSFPASMSFQMSQPFASSGQSIGVSASASVLLMNIQDWFPLGLTGLISTIVQRHQFFDAQPSLWSNSHIRTWLLEKP